MAKTPKFNVPPTCTLAFARLTKASPNVAAALAGVVTDDAATPEAGTVPVEDVKTLQTYAVFAVRPVTVAVAVLIPATVTLTVPGVPTQSTV
jgi:hypothetical protein